jgi:hypothetical protein
MAVSEDKIDRRQFRALIRAGLKTDLRGTRNPFGGMMKKTDGIPPFVGLVAFYFLVGIVMAVVLVVRAGHFFVGALLLQSSVMTFIAISVLLEYSNVILSPDDWDIIAPQPVNSKTFFAAKLANLMIYVTILAGAVGLPPALAYGVVSGGIPAALLLLLNVLAAAVTTATFFVIFYTVMLRFTDRERMNSALSYLQLVLIIIFYAVMLVLPRQIGSVTDSLAVVTDEWWVYLLPPSWFASVPSLLVEPVTNSRLAASTLAFVSLVVFLTLALKRLSLGYARSLSDTVSRQQRRRAASIPGQVNGRRSRILSPEDRVVSRLIRAQFKHDNRFKVLVLSVLPLALLYLYLGTSEGEELIDPFLSRDLVTGEGTIMIYIAVAFLPVMILGGTTMSSSYQAAWVFSATPANRLRLVVATKRFALLYFCLPFLALIVALMTYYFGNFIHALLHSITLLVLCFIASTVMLMMLGKLPFSVPPKKGRATGGFILSWIVPIILVVPPMAVIAEAGYGSYGTYAMVVVGLIFVAFLLTILQNHVVSQRVTKLELAEE